MWPGDEAIAVPTSTLMTSQHTRKNTTIASLRTSCIPAVQEQCFACVKPNTNAVSVKCPWLSVMCVLYLVLLLLSSCCHGFPNGGRGTAPAMEDPGGGLEEEEEERGERREVKRREDAKHY